MLDLESLFKLSYGMCIVGSRKEDRLNGCIVNTVFQITPEPPMVAASINRACLTHEYISNSRVLSVSILSTDAPMPFIGRFGFRSGRDANKFEQVNFKTGRTGSPIVLDNTAAFLEVEVTDSIDILTHTLFIGKIVASETLDDEAVPMTYDYYRDIKHGRTPKTAATYISVEPKLQKQKEPKE
ncbi:MAG TPA: flavin reductase family protein [Sedimentisphaerales bacterium]|nr:flavin reductase family protein [Sedimentisphaerales bacterium]